MSYFYAHIVNPDDLAKEIEVLDVSAEDRAHLFMVVQSTLHHRVIDALLEELHDDHKHIFLTHIVEENHEGVWRVLNEHVDGAEDKIRQTYEWLRAELMADIHEQQDQS